MKPYLKAVAAVCVPLLICGCGGSALTSADYEDSGEEVRASGWVTATAISSTRIDLAWEDGMTKELGFQIERGLDATTYTLIASTDPNVTNYTDLDVRAGTTYYYRVAVLAPRGGPRFSAPVSATTPPAEAAVGINLVPVALSLSPQAPLPGDAVTFSAQVKNAGDTDLVDGQLGALFTVNGATTLWYTLTPTTTIRAGQTVTLAARSGPSGTGTWTAGPAGTYSLAVAVDDLNRIAESNDSDNTMSRTFTVGDAPSACSDGADNDGDGNIDFPADAGCASASDDDETNGLPSDTTLPAIAIGAPASGATVSGLVSVTGTASDNVALSKVEVRIDSASFAAVSGTASWSFSWNTASLSNGSHTVTARATDTAGNTRTATVSVTVSNGTTPPPTGDWPTSETTGTRGTLTPDARTYLSESTTYDSIHFTDTGTIYVVSENATFTNCRFDGAVVFAGAHGTTVTACEFPQGLGVSSSSNMLFERVKMENFRPADAFHITSDGGSMCTDIVIRDCFVSNSLSEADAHADGIQIRGSVRLHIDHCVFDMGEYREQHNAAIYSENANGNNTDLLVENSFFKGGGYTLYLSSGTGVFRNNTVSPGVFGYVYETPTGITCTGNLDENGAPLLLQP